MKIEKISENQIRCTLTRADLENHQIRLSELAYGTDKARKLFQEMMEQAHLQVGFSVDNTPLMIEAIPVSTDSIILLITKVEDPEELDTRFSRFAPFKHDGNTPALELEGADDIIDIFRKIRETVSRAHDASKEGKESAGRTHDEPQHAPEQGTDSAIDLLREYRFRNLEDLIQASRNLQGFYNGKSTLYKDAQPAPYQLIIHQSGSSPEDFNKVCNILSEYASGRNFSMAGEAYLSEHGNLVLQEAVRSLGAL